ncbi:Mitochondrial Tricarboxylate Carrier (MTC) Family [Thraustotheca clavata]|uniref:Mitochondrial Tricarboxylate Carrier (MTC) Family n=1 Tax=Thraustotheca clavata TaxID=74557 RepID=A0A1W0A2H3_9STRA|nr:Mitochondrial Tricarboxylate Carrier (MTC) Family [Thraustotheca clavata]
MASEVPPFTLDAPRYDQSTYYGRWKHFSDLVALSSFFVSDKQIDASKELIDNYKNGVLPKGSVTDAQLWDARRICECVFHPQTGEKLPMLFRMPAFVPVNIPICSGMVLAPPTLFNTIFWQWVNQSYNAGFNYANRNASGVDDTTAIAKAYASAVLISCGASVGLGKAVEHATFLGATARLALSRTVPFVAVAAAGAGNAVFMRLKELTEGIDVIDNEGVARGRSQNAGKQSLTQVAMTRVALPMPILLFPPFILEGLKKVNAMPKNRVGRVIAEVSVVTLCIWGAFPAAIALFPQYGTIAAKDLEPQFQQLTNSKGQLVKEFTYNKGI